MSLSGFLYLAIVVGWAVYLVPFALKRYDEATRNRSVDRFSSAMRVLGRRDLGAGGPGAMDTITTVKPSASRPEPSRQAQRVAARVAAKRRRRVLVTLLAATVATAGVAAFSLIPWWSIAIPAALVLAWLLTCRSQVRRENDAYWSEAADRADSTETGRTHLPQHREGELSRSRRLVGGSAEPDAGEDDEPTVVLDHEELAQVAVAVETTDGSTLWDPVPVTLPTYVSKPRAPRTIRTIELGEPGTWTSGRTEESAALVEHAEQADQAAYTDAGSAEQAETPRRAVGE